MCTANGGSIFQEQMTPEDLPVMYHSVSILQIYKTDVDSSIHFPLQFGNSLPP